MSRRFCWFLAILLFANAAPAALACPGSMAIGLPLLFGCDDPPSPWPTTPARDAWPVIDFAPADLEEAQEFRAPPGDKEMAKECLKAWRQLIRDRRYELAPAVAAKAVALDPTNLDARHAVIVSQVLRSIDANTSADVKVAVKATGSTTCLSTCPIMDCATGACPANGCPACAKQAETTAQKTSRPSGSIEFKISLSPSGLSLAAGTGVAIGQSGSLPTAASKSGTTCVTGSCPTAQPTVENAIVEHALKHMFPDGLLVAQPSRPTGSVIVATPVSSSAAKATTGFATCERASGPELKMPTKSSTFGISVPPFAVFPSGPGVEIFGTPVSGVTKATREFTDVDVPLSPPNASCGYDSIKGRPIVSVEGSVSGQHVLENNKCVSVIHGPIREVLHAMPATPAKRVSIKTAAWLVECDRVILMDEREMIVDGNVHLTMRQRDVSVQGSRVRVNLNDGSIQVDSK